MKPKEGRTYAVGTAIIFAAILLLFFCSVTLRADWSTAFRNDPFLAVTAQPLDQIGQWLASDQLATHVDMARQLDKAPLGRMFWPHGDSALPDGKVLPLFLLRWMSGDQSRIAWLMAFNLCCQLMTALLLGMAAYGIAKRVGFDGLGGCILGLIPPIFVLFLPGPMFWYLMPIAPHAAPTLILAAVVAVETARIHASRRGAHRALALIQSMLLVLGCCLESAFLFVAAGVFVWRVVLRRMTLPELFATALRTIGVGFAGCSVLFFIGKYAPSTEHPAAVAPYLGQDAAFWSIWMPEAYGALAGPALGLFLVAAVLYALSRFMVRRRPDDVDVDTAFLMSLLGFLTAPFLLYALWAGHGSWAEPSGVMPFVVPFALLPFVVAPLALAKLLAPSLMEARICDASFEAGQSRIQGRISVLPLLCLVATLCYVAQEHGRFRGFFPEPTRYPKLLAEAGERYSELTNESSPETVAGQAMQYARGIPLNDSLALVDYRLRRSAHDRYRLELLFRSYRKMDVDWFIDIRAEVADENRNRLPSDRQMMGYDEWGFVPGPPTSAWPENAYVLVGVNVAAEAVPYALHLSLFRRKWQPQPIPETEETRPTSSEFSDRALERVQFGRTITLSVNDPADQSQPAFLRNAGFDEWEDGMPVGWAARDAYREKFVERVSDEVHGTVLRTNPGHHWTLYKQTVPVYGLVAGKTIRLHARALSHDGRVRAMLNIDGKQVLGPSHPGDGRWRTIWVEYEVPNDFRKTEFTIGATLDGPPQSHILLDDFAIAIE